MSTDGLQIISFGDHTPPLLDSALPPFPSVHHRHQEMAQTGIAPARSLHQVVQQVAKAKKVAVVCGAGISCASGIPDFRSSEGLFQSLKRQHPEAKLGSGKDLFDASLFQSEQNASIFYNMIAELKNMADEAQPTAFHRFLKSLDDDGKLFRVYTQNIDALEEKAGLSYGLGDKSLPLPPRRASRSPSKARTAKATEPSARSSVSTSASQASTSTSVSTTAASSFASTPVPDYTYPSPAPSPAREATPPPSVDTATSALTSSPATHAVIPKCIPLHGHLKTVTCFHCSTTLPIEPHLPSLAAGSTIYCPACLKVDAARTERGARSRGVGRLRPDVVLYGEPHPDGERVGTITQRDLMGPRPDLLLVVGTSLKVPGTKRLVRELAKVIRPGWEYVPASSTGKDSDELCLPLSQMTDDASPSLSQASNTSTASSKTQGKARRRAPAIPPVHVVYLNFDFPRPAGEWRDVFDVWVRGDAQEFARMVEQERFEVDARRRGKQEQRTEVKASAASTSREGSKKKLNTTKPKVSSKSLENSVTKSKTKTVGGAARPRIVTAKANSTQVQRPLPVKRRSSAGRTPSVATLASSGTARQQSQPSLKLSFAVTKASFADVTGTGKTSSKGTPGPLLSGSSAGITGEGINALPMTRSMARTRSGSLTITGSNAQPGRR